MKKNKKTKKSITEGLEKLKDILKVDYESYADYTKSIDKIEKTNHWKHVSQVVDFEDAEIKIMLDDAMLKANTEGFTVGYGKKDTPKPSTTEDFQNLVVGDIVEVARINDYHGWDDGMDEILGGEYEIVATRKDGVYLYNDNYGENYIFPFESLNIVSSSANNSHEEIIKNVTIDGCDYALTRPKRITINSLKKYMLVSDFNLFKEIYKDKAFLSLYKDLFKEVKLKCPRVIGVLLSNNYIVNTGESEND